MKKQDKNLVSMIRILKNKSLPEIRGQLVRPSDDLSSIMPMVSELFAEIRTGGDNAVREFTLKYDGISISDLEVTEREITEASAKLPDDLKSAIDRAIENIGMFHKAQKCPDARVETMPGVFCWQKQVAVESVGLYIPGGSAPLFSTVLMLAVPAVIAGCREIILCTPPGKAGVPDPAILYAADRSGVTRIFRIGGIQAIAAMATGTESVPAVSKIFGPGNRYVTAAKQLASSFGVAIDLPAGPSEVMVVADETADPCFIASDLLSQAEHGSDSQAVLLTTCERIAAAVADELDRQINMLPRKDIALSSISNSAIVIAASRDEMVAIMNDYAPEHLILSVNDPYGMADRVVNAGSVFLGNYTPESAGDYASGTNHTLPTNGFAKGWSGVGLDSFMKRISFQEISRDGLSLIAPIVSVMARAENLEGHARAVELRIKNRNNE